MIAPSTIPTRAYLLLFLAAVATRVVVCVTAMIAFDIPLEAYTDKGDGQSYKRYALVIRGQPTEFTNYDTRVFPGYPLLIAAAGLPPGIGALAIDFLSVGLAAVFAARLFADLRVGWAMVFLIPHYVINSSLAMSEAPLLACSLGALVLAVRLNRPLVGGLVMGLAGLIRPMAAFAAGGYLVWAWAGRQRRPALAFAVASGTIVVAGLAGLHLAFGDALQGVRAYANEPGAYNGSIFTWPFGSLVLTPLHDASARTRIPYIYIHVLITLAGCVLLLRRLLIARPDTSSGAADQATAQVSDRVAQACTHACGRRTGMSTCLCHPETPDEVAQCAGRDLSYFTAPWLIANTLFVLCIGSHWGYDHFPRFTIPAQAALFVAYQRWLPRAWWVWGLIGVATIGLGIWGVKNSP